MCHLVMDGSVNVQRMAYQLLQEAAKKYTEELVIEAAVDTEATMKSELPTELLDILQRSLNHEEAEEYGQVLVPFVLVCLRSSLTNSTGVVRLSFGLDGYLRPVHRCGT